MKLIVAVIAVLAITSCAVRETREKVITVNGQEFLCSYTHNNLSGNETEQTCVPFAATTTEAP